MHNIKTAFLGLVTMTVLFALPVNADDEHPYLRSDDSWISISGKAVETKADSFQLDYGEGNITVEMDDWDWYEEMGEVLEGDKVTVYGEIDDDLLEATKIEAESVYVESLGTSFYYPSSVDEEGGEVVDYEYDYMVTTPVVVGFTQVNGVVSGIDGREFTLNTGKRKITIDTTSLAYNPMDKEGFQQISKGDIVSVTGDMEKDFFEKKELIADSVVTIENDKSKKSG